MTNNASGFIPTPKQASASTDLYIREQMDAVAVKINEALTTRYPPGRDVIVSLPGSPVSERAVRLLTPHYEERGWRVVRDTIDGASHITLIITATDGEG
jgi:hypothetical protein